MPVSKAVVALPNGMEVTSIILTEDEFECLCEDMENWFQLMGKEQFRSHVESAREQKFIPLMGLDDLTERFFHMYQAQTPLMSIIVEGQTEKKLEEAMRAEMGAKPHSRLDKLDLN